MNKIESQIKKLFKINDESELYYYEINSNDYSIHSGYYTDFKKCRKAGRFNCSSHGLDYSKLKIIREHKPSGFNLIFSGLK